MAHATAAADEYVRKTSRYFSGARRTFVDLLPLNESARLLEIGCGNGDTAAYALKTRKCGWATGVELCAEPAKEAAAKLQQVLIGDIEQMETGFDAHSFDVLILSEVLEHLRDPWRVLRGLHRTLRPGAIVLAGSPNACHHSVIRMMLRGRWDLEDVGIMDRTHLRWFTPSSYAAMFQDSGYLVTHVGPAHTLSPKARLLNTCTGGFLEHLLYTQIFLRATVN